MTQRYDLIVFDWDGTIMDSTGLIAACIRESAESVGLPVPDVESAKSVIGLGVGESIRRLFADIDEAQLSAFAAHYRARFLAQDHQLPLYDGIAALLGQLDQPHRLLAVATGKSRRGLDRALDYSGLHGRFHFTRCADEGRPKPHPDMLLHLMDVAGVEAARTLMIGDTTHDLDLAANAGVDAIAVAYGAHDRATLEAYRGGTVYAVAGSVPELASWLTRHA